MIYLGEEDREKKNLFLTDATKIFETKTILILNYAEGPTAPPPPPRSLSPWTTTTNTKTNLIGPQELRN